MSKKSKLEPPAVADTTILFHLPAEKKQALIKAVKRQNLTIKGILNNLIDDYLDKLKQAVKPEKKKTGRGNTNLDEIEKAKAFLRKMHPKPIRKVELSNYVGCSQARALIILNILSGVSNDKEKDGAEFVSKDFLVGENDDTRPTTYFVAKDRELGIEL